MRPIKKTLIVRVCDQEIVVNVDFDVIRIIEETFGLGADAVVPIFAQPMKIQRHKVAQIIMEWVALKQTAISRREIVEEVTRASPDKLGVHIGNIYAALLFLLNYYSEDETENERRFDEVAQNLKAGEIPAEGRSSKKKEPAAKKKPSLESATKLQ